MSPAPDLVTRFFELLEERQLPGCAELLQAAQHEGSTEPGWLDYLQAILYSEKSPPRWDRAQQALQHVLSINPPNDLCARTHLELGWAADYLGDYADSIEHYRLSLELFQQIDDRSHLAKVLKNTGIAHTRAYERGQAGLEALEAALACHKRSLAFCRELSDERLAATVELELGTVHKALGHWEQARAFYSAR